MFYKFFDIFSEKARRLAAEAEYKMVNNCGEIVPRSTDDNNESVCPIGTCLLHDINEIVLTQAQDDFDICVKIPDKEDLAHLIQVIIGGSISEHNPLVESAKDFIDKFDAGLILGKELFTALGVKNGV